MRALLHERLRDGLAQLMIAEPEGPAIDYGRDTINQGDGGHGKHGTTSCAPPSVSSLAVEWAEFFSRALDMVELDLAHVRGTTRPPGVVSTGRVSNEAAKARKRRITTLAIYRGRPDAFVAYVEGCSADLVRKARAAKDQDSYGLKRPTVRPLTSSKPAPDTEVSRCTPPSP